MKQTPNAPSTEQTILKDYGWNAHYQAQMTLDEPERTWPVRVLAVHRDALEVAGPSFAGRVSPLSPSDDDGATATVGDWILIEAETKRTLRVLERISLFKRKGAGTARRVQLLAANVDTLLLVTSANQDFNPARLERYLALAFEAGVTLVVVITKADLTDDIASYEEQARKLRPGLVVEAFDARDAAAVARLSPWFGRGQTVALLGSSGVGKSTLVNTMAGGVLQTTQGIREDDAKGRHTTSGRSLHRLANGAWLLDTPGMRELQLVDAVQGIAEVFDDLAAIAAQCRFSDCTHSTEPGCAIRSALDSGVIEPERLKRFEKLQREERHNSESIAKSRARSKSFGRMAKRVFADKLKKREW